MSKTITIKITPEIEKKLTKLTKETERTKSFHVNKALQTYLDNYAELQIALDRLNDQTDEVISSNEMREMLGV